MKKKLAAIKSWKTLALIKTSKFREIHGTDKRYGETLIIFRALQ